MIAVAAAAAPEEPLEGCAEDFLTGAAATRLAGISPTRLQRLALLKKVRVRLPEGEPPRYNRADLLRLFRPGD